MYKKCLLLSVFQLTGIGLIFDSCLSPEKIIQRHAKVRVLGLLELDFQYSFSLNIVSLKVLKS